MYRCFIFSTLLALVACSGGNTDNPGIVPAGVTVSPFTAMSAIEPGQVVEFPDSITRSSLYREDGVGRVAETIQEAWTAPRIWARFDEAAEFEAVQLRGRGVTFDAATARTVRETYAEDERFLVLVKSDGALDDSFSVADPHTFGFEHLLFGAWLESALFTSPYRVGLLQAGAFGTFSEAASLPPTGRASYAGGVIGFVVQADRLPARVSADVSLDADFDGRSVAFATTAPRNLVTGDILPDLAATGTFAIDDNRFDGTATAANGWQGLVAGRFFGPNGEEVGGAFDLAGPGVQRYLAGFGARR